MQRVWDINWNWKLVSPARKIWMLWRRSRPDPVAVYGRCCMPAVVSRVATTAQCSFPPMLSFRLPLTPIADEQTLQTLLRFNHSGVAVAARRSSEPTAVCGR